jgi:sensor histidine kinase YesM
MSEMSVQNTSQQQSKGTERINRIVFWFLLWTVLGLFQATRLYFAYNSGDNFLISWGQAISWALADWYIWGLLSLFIIRINRLWLLPRGFRWKAVGIHALLAVVFSVVQLALYTIAYRALDGLFYHRVGTSLLDNWSYFEGFLRGKFHAAVFAYLLIAMISYALESYRRLRNEEIRLARLMSQLAKAELEALKVQLHPHFLFNTLNSISALIHSDPDLAETAIARLSELLRMTMETSGQTRVALRNELDFTERYLELQQMRFGDRLTVQRSLAPETLDALVPNLILQPIVENAIRHGIAGLTEGGRIELKASQERGQLVLSVFDNGPGIDIDHKRSDAGGFGLRSTRERLLHLYGDKAGVAIVSPDTGGTGVVLKMPFETE